MDDRVKGLQEAIEHLEGELMRLTQPDMQKFVDGVKFAIAHLKQRKHELETGGL